MSIMTHLNDLNGAMARENRELPSGAVTSADHLRLVDPHLDKLCSLFAALCDQQGYQDRIDAVDRCLAKARRQSAFLNCHKLGEIGITSRNCYIYILRRWRSDIAPMPHNPDADDFINGPDPVMCDPSDTNLQPEDCAA